MVLLDFKVIQNCRTKSAEQKLLFRGGKNIKSSQTASSYFDPTLIVLHLIRMNHFDSEASL